MVMEKIKLKLYEIMALKGELQGNHDTKGLLQQELPFFIKYRLHSLNIKIITECDVINKIKEELIRKYGEVNEEGDIEILLHTSDGRINPKYTAFQLDYYQFMEEEKEIEYNSFKLDDIKDVTTGEYYPVFSKLVIE